jgi:hypothetical protein
LYYKSGVKSIIPTKKPDSEPEDVPPPLAWLKTRNRSDVALHGQARSTAERAVFHHWNRSFGGGLEATTDLLFASEKMRSLHPGKEPGTSDLELLKRGGTETKLSTSSLIAFVNRSISNDEFRNSLPFTFPCPSSESKKKNIPPFVKLLLPALQSRSSETGGAPRSPAPRTLIQLTLRRNLINRRVCLLKKWKFDREGLNFR